MKFVKMKIFFLLASFLVHSLSYAEKWFGNIDKKAKDFDTRKLQKDQWIVRDSREEGFVTITAKRHDGKLVHFRIKATKMAGGDILIENDKRELSYYSEANLKEKISELVAENTKEEKWANALRTYTPFEENCD